MITVVAVHVYRVTLMGGELGSVDVTATFHAWDKLNDAVEDWIVRGKR